MGLLDRLRGGALAPSATPPPADPSSPGVSRFAVIDVETTGLDPERERVLELAILRADEQGRPIDQWVTRFHPGGPVRATHIHGITDADVAGAPRFADLAVQIGTALQGLVLVAHNAEFDLAFLQAEFARASLPMPQVSTYCTLQGSRSRPAASAARPGRTPPGGTRGRTRRCARRGQGPAVRCRSARRGPRSAGRRRRPRR